MKYRLPSRYVPFESVFVSCETLLLHSSPVRFLHRDAQGLQARAVLIQASQSFMSERNSKIEAIKAQETEQAALVEKLRGMSSVHHQQSLCVDIR
jgi:hypothetical protein